MKLQKVVTTLVVLAFTLGTAWVPALAAPAPAPTAAGGGTTRLIPSSGSTSPATGDFTPSGVGDATQVEFAGEMDSAAGPSPFPGMIVSHNLPQGGGHNGANDDAKRAKSNPVFNTGFEGLNLYQQRYARGGNQFTVEPPDQGMCAGNGYVVEAVNDVFNAYNTSGKPATMFVAVLSGSTDWPAGL